MNWQQLLWPAEATTTERLFRWVTVQGSLCWILYSLLPIPQFNYPLVFDVLQWVSYSCVILFPLLASYLLRNAAKKAAKQRHPTSWRVELFNIGAFLLLLVGVCQLLLFGFFVLLLFDPGPWWEPRADGDSLFG